MKYTWEDVPFGHERYTLELEIEYQATPVTHESPQEGGDISVEDVRLLSGERIDVNPPRPIRPKGAALWNVYWTSRFNYEMDNNKDFEEKILLYCSEHADSLTEPKE